MLFDSLGFAAFLILVLLFFKSSLSWRLKKVGLMLASYLFYGLWNPALLGLLWLSTLVDWTVGQKLGTTSAPGARKRWLGLSLTVNLGILGLFKYGDFLLANGTWLLNHLGWPQLSSPRLDIILPMGISFYTFQTMSYSIDVYRKHQTPSTDLLDFALYVTFFPQLVAGPIVRAKELLSHFAQERRASVDQFLWGCFLLTLGLTEKMVFADALLAESVDKVFDSHQSPYVVDAWAAAFAFSAQIFFDFAGYSTCAIGLALMLGFQLPQNFRYPYAAVGFSDHWRRWHISLSSWLRDYLYIPLGGNRGGQLSKLRALMLTMLLGGLWHGAAWTYVAWGALHGCYLLLERVVKRYVTLKKDGFVGFLLAGGTFVCVTISLAIFRSRDLAAAQGMLTAMLIPQQLSSKPLTNVELLVIAVVVVALFLTHWFMRERDLREVCNKIPPLVFGLVWALMLFAIAISNGPGQQFIYFQF